MKPTRIVVLIGLAFACYILLSLFQERRRGLHIRQQILAQDFSCLLTGCRDLIEKRTVLVNDWADRKGESQGTIVLDSKIRPFGNEVPSVIRDLKPIYIAIENDRVFVNMSKIPRNAILGFATNAPQFGSVKLIDGLWLWTGRQGEAATNVNKWKYDSQQPVDSSVK